MTTCHKLITAIMFLFFLAALPCSFAAGQGAQDYAYQNCKGVSFSRNLTLNSAGRDVMCLQSLLNQDPDTKVAVSGYGSPGDEIVLFNAATQSAVKKYQQKNGINPTGVAGPLTRVKLDEAVSSLKPSAPVVPPAPAATDCSKIVFSKSLYKGMSDGDVKCLQVVLNKDSATQVASSGNGSSGKETFYFGLLTKLAVIKFQQKYGISAIGAVGPKTRTKLNELASGAESGTPPPTQTCQNTVSSCGIYPDCAFCSSGQTCVDNSCETLPTTGQCPTGSITTSCMCDGAKRTSGYCCNNTYQSSSCPACTPGTTQSCLTGFFGICSAGSQTCQSDSSWSACAKISQPTAESTANNNCSDGKDNDCNGLTDAQDSACQTGNKPVISHIGAKTATTGQLLTFTISATDPDKNAVLTYSAIGLPTGATFNASSHVFSWTPGDNQAGNYSVTFSVLDGKLSASEIVSINVLQNTSNPVNVALHKSYTLSPAPNYAISTGPSDSTDLTDGVLTYTSSNDSSCMWCNQLSVGWVPATSATITIDLGSDQPISSVKYSTISHAPNQAFWPSSIDVLVSADNANYYFITDMMRDDPNIPPVPTSGNSVKYMITATGLNTHGRYVKFVVFDTHIHVDEIQIYNGGSNNSYAGGSLPLSNDALITALRLIGRMQTDLDSVKQAAQSAGVSIASQIDSIQSRISGFRDFGNIQNIKTFLPQPSNTVAGQIQQDTLKLNALVLQNKGFSGTVVWTGNTWDPISPYTAPPRNSSAGTINLNMMNGERRGKVINLTNAGDSQKTVNIGVNGFGGSNNPSWISLSKVQSTDTTDSQVSGNEAISDMLLPISSVGNGYAVNIPAGMTQQVWLEFEPVSLPVGDNPGNILVSDGSSNSTVNVDLAISQYAFPQNMSLSLGMWDYVDGSIFLGNTIFDITPSNAPAVKQFMDKYHFDLPWSSGTLGYVNGSNFDSDNNFIPGANYFDYFDNWVALFPNAKIYEIAVDGHENGDLSDTGTNAFTAPAAFSARVASWVGAFEDHLASKGIDQSKVAFSPIDEPTSQQKERDVIAWGKAMRDRTKKYSSHIQLFVDTSGLASRDPESSVVVDGDTVYSVADILCPSSGVFAALSDPNHFFNFFLDQRVNHGKDLNFYDGAGRDGDPYALYLLRGWLAYKYGADAVQYWSLGDSGGDRNMNDYTAKAPIYTPLYFDGSNVYAGKKMEAVYEGREDYEYLKILNNLANNLETQDSGNSLIADARNLSNTAVSAVTSSLFSPGYSEIILWRNDKDRSLSSQYTTAIWSKINQLSSATGLSANQRPNSLKNIQSQLASISDAILNLLNSLKK